MREPLPARPGRRVDRQEQVAFECRRDGTVCCQALLNICTGQNYREASSSNGSETFERTLGHCLHQLV